MDWFFLLKIIMAFIVIYTLHYFEIAWIGLILSVIIIWDQFTDLKSVSIINKELEEKIQRLEEIIEK